MHSHGHVHGPASTDGAPDFGKAFKIGIALNLGFVLLEFICGLLFNSVSLLADAGHNLTDVLGLGVAYVAFQLATSKPTRRFTFGLGSSTIIASTLNGALLLVAVGVISWEAISRLSDPVDVHGVGVIVVALIGVAINTLTAALFFKGQAHDLNVKGAYLHMMADAIVSVGVALAGTIILITGLQWVDPVTSLIIAAVIFYSTWGLFHDSIQLLTLGVPANVNLEEIHSYLMQRSGVVEVHDLHVWALSTTRNALTAHLVREHSNDADELLLQITKDLEHRFGIDHATIQLESRSFGADCPLTSDETV